MKNLPSLSNLRGKAASMAGNDSTVRQTKSLHLNFAKDGDTDYGSNRVKKWDSHSPPVEELAREQYPSNFTEKDYDLHDPQ